jgi:hypothetical protein
MTACGLLSHFYYIWVIFSQFGVVFIFWLQEIITQRKKSFIEPAAARTVIRGLVCGCTLMLLVNGPYFFKAVLLKYLGYKGGGDDAGFAIILVLLTGGRNLGLPAALFLAFCVLGLFALWRRGKKNFVLYFIFLLFVPLALIKIAFSRAMVRFFLYALPLLLLSCAYGIYTIAQKRWVIVGTLIVVFVIIQVPALTLHFQYRQAGAQNYRSAAALIDRLAGDKDTVYAIGIGASGASYYLKKHKVTIIKTKKQEKDFLPEEQKIWLIVTYPEYIYRLYFPYSEISEAKIYNTARNKMRLAATFHGQESDIYIYTSVKP